MSLLTIMQTCALAALVLAAVRGGMAGETVEGEGAITLLIIGVLMVISLVASVAMS